MMPTPDTLAQAARSATRRGPPPVHLWNPPDCGPIDMRISRDGTWFYQGSPIGRAPLVRLFSSILRRDGDTYVLVTPAEKVTITVDDLPLHAIDVTATGAGTDQILTFVTRTEDEVTAGPDHPIRIGIDPETREPAPAIHVRGGLWARIDRKTFFRLVDLGCHHDHQGDSWFGLWSGGRFFPAVLSAELP